MTPVPATADRPEAPLFSDGLGERIVAVDAASGDLLQILRVRPQLLTVPSFEFALRERAARLANFRHAYYARVRRVDRHPGGLAIVSDHVEGVRLSDMLRVAEERALHLDLNAALCLIRQLVPSIALLHENARDVAHGLVAPERLIVTPRARLVVVEHVLGSAVEQLQFDRERLWRELRVALPASVGAPRFDHRADVSAVGVVALALVLGRPIRAEEYPHRAAVLLDSARARSAVGEDQPLPESLHAWIARALQLDARSGFMSATEAQIGLEDALADDTGFVAAPVALETFLSRYIAALLEPPIARPLPPPAPPTLPAPPAVTPPAVTPPAPPPVDPPVGELQFPKMPAALKPESATREPAQSEPARPEPARREPGSPGAAKAEAANPAPLKPAATMAAGGIAPARTPQPTPEAWAPHGAQAAARAPIPVRAPVAHPAAASDSVSSPAQRSTPSPSPAPALPTAPVKPPVASARAEPGTIATPEEHPAKPEPRDITELLRDFDLPSTPAAKAHLEAAVPEPVDPRRSRLAGWRRIAGAVVLLAAAGGGALYATRALRSPAPVPLGTLSVQTNPQGVAVFVDGEAHGKTPARVALKAGAHILELRGRGVPRVIPVTVPPGAEVSQYLELPQTPLRGSLIVQSDPAGAQVRVDGVARGTAPVTVTDLNPGEHEVVLEGAGGPPVHQRVVIEAGVTASVLTPVTTVAPGPVSGWISVKAPVSIEIREGGRLLGTTDEDRLMLASGRHEIQLVNETLGYRATRAIQVPAGKVAPVVVELPQGVINLNASPWAEVWIDGKRVGETPMGNLPVAIGPHEVLFRHPQLGEKRQAVSVTLSAPVRLSVDMK